MPAAEAGVILEAIKTLCGFRSSLTAAKVERRKRMADLFLAVSECLAQTAAEIRKGKYPSDRCRELEMYALDLPERVQDEIGKAKAKAVSEELLRAHRIENLYYMDRTKPEGEQSLQMIEEASGMLRALGNLVRV
jgi:hypothetical protein